MMFLLSTWHAIGETQLQRDVTFASRIQEAFGNDQFFPVNLRKFVNKHFTPFLLYWVSATMIFKAAPFVFENVQVIDIIQTFSLYIALVGHMMFLMFLTIRDKLIEMNEQHAVSTKLTNRPTLKAE